MLSRRHYVHSNELVGERQRRNVIFSNELVGERQHRNVIFESLFRLAFH